MILKRSLKLELIVRTISKPYFNEILRFIKSVPFFLPEGVKSFALFILFEAIKSIVFGSLLLNRLFDLLSS
jgi:hypothetical protein